MKQLLRDKLFLMVTVVAALLLGLPAAGYAQDEEPIIVLKTSAYDTYGESNACQILIGGIKDDYIDVDCGFGMEEHELKPATLDDDGTWSGTLITCNVSKEGVIKIYGDASNIDVLDFHGCYLRRAEFPTLTNLVILDMSHNELEVMDLSPFTKLQSLEINDNPFNVTPLIVGGNKPNLMVLNLGQIQALDQSFNLSDYPELRTFDAWSNSALMTLNPAGCPKLQKISIDSTPVAELDVTNNPALQILNISDTGIKSIDLTKNPYLMQFYCDHLSGTVNAAVKLTSLDVTKNPNLIYLFASGNDLKSVDISQNKYLSALYLNNNLLTSINLDNNPNLVQVSLRNNYLNFATLPMPGEWNVYEYAQRAMPVAKSMKEGTVLDFSDKVLREGTTTTAALYMTSESNPGVITPLGADYYTYADGKVTLLKAVSDSVYVAFANDAFPTSALTSQPLCTTKFMVKTAENYGANDKVITFSAPIVSSAGTPVAFGLGIYGATPETPKKFYVDCGDGDVEYTATSETAPQTYNATFTAKSGTITISVPENELVTAFDMENVTLNSINLSKAPSLKHLRLVNANMYGSIDLGWNRSLQSLELTGNHFTTLNIRGVNDAYQKNVLHDINLSNNELTAVTLNDNMTIYNLNLSNNKLTELSFKDADMLKTLDVSNNKLTAIDVNYSTMMTSLNIAGNSIASIVLPTETALETLHCENNALTFATLPQLAGLKEFTFSPQNDITIAKIGSGVDLSEQNAGGNTSYVWKKADGTTLVNGTDYTEEDGKTRFLTPAVGSVVYCEMTNPAFSGLTLKTSAIEAAGMPTNVFAEFTTTADGTARLVLVATEPETPVYIDWKGDGVELEQYLVNTTPTSFDITTHKGATVKVYSYAEKSNLTVFSITGAAMSSMDVSGMKQLICLTVKDAGLSEIKLPESNDLFEVYLDGNNFSEIDLTRYGGLQYLTMNNNLLTTFDASLYPNLQILALGDNQLTSVKLGNNNLWSLSLSGNQLTDIDLTKVPNVEQLALGNNELAHIDVSALNKLKVLFLDYNKFKFSTLPVDKGYARYTYANQSPLEATVVDGKVDLSSEAVIDGASTVYRWFVDVPSYDESGELVGEELYVDDEYTLDNGVTTFLTSVDDVMCVLTNEKFPDLVLYTPLMDVTAATGIGSVMADGSKASVSVSGNTITVNATDGTAVRLFGIDGRQVGSLVTDNGTGVFSGIAPGVYVVAVGNSAYKVRVR